MKKVVNLTKAGKAELEQELANLIAQRPAIAERIATARAFGDLSKNTMMLVPNKKSSKIASSRSKIPSRTPFLSKLAKVIK